MARIILALCFVVCIFQSGNGQSSMADSTSQVPTSSAITLVKSSNFNNGINHQPYGLISGRVPGLGMSMAGNDPNGEFVLRVRGLSTLQAQTRPLLVIDGFVAEDLLTVDPADIEEITLLRDAAAAAAYGIRGGNGVLLIRTKSAGQQPFSVSYNTTFGFEKAALNIAPISSSEYRGYANSIDLGSDQNWLDQVSRTGYSTIHNLVLSAHSKSLSVRSSVNFRKANGTLTGTGFDQVNTRLNLEQKAFGDKLAIRLNLASTNRNSDYGFREAIKYAYSANPTMPVVGDVSQHGGYYQMGVFDNYNPVAIIRQNKNEGKRRSLFAGLEGEYQFDGFLKGVGLRIGYQAMDNNEFSGRYYAKRSYYVGEVRNGLASRESAAGVSQQVNSSLNYAKEIGLIDFKLTTGYQFQGIRSSSFYAEGGDFLTDAFTYNNLEASGDFRSGRATVTSSEDLYKVASWINTMSLVFDDKYFINAVASYSGSSRLGKNNKSGLFPSIGGGVQWKDGIAFFNFLKVRTSWGKAGNIPQQSNLSVQLLSPGNYTLQDGVFKPYYYTTRDANPDLKWEEKAELNIGTDFALLNNKLTGSFDWFTNNVTDMISRVNVPSPPYLSYSMIANLGKLQNRGFELNLNANAIRTSGLIWDIQFNLSHVKTVVKSIGTSDYSLGQNGELSIGILPDASCGCGGYGVMMIREGDVLGQIQGPVFTGVVNGDAQYKDLSGDGFYCNCPDDSQTLANALPKATYGLGSRLAFGAFEVDLMFRGAAGHHKVNSFRLAQESVEAIPHYNLIKTGYFTPDLRFSQLSSHFVEAAGFLRLDNLSVSYRVPTVFRMRIQATVQNLFTLTKYTGGDPEVAYGEPAVYGATRYVANTSPLVSGIEPRGNYFSGRTFSLGIGLSL